jgi:hypothetical protein
MNFEQFKYYLDAYGASFERWPEELRPAGEAFLASSGAAAAARREAARLDALLARYAVEPEPGGARRMAEAVLAGAKARGGGSLDGRFGLSGLWPRAAALALAAVLGIVVGISQFERSLGDITGADFAQTQASDSPFEVAGL